VVKRDSLQEEHKLKVLAAKCSGNIWVLERYYITNFVTSSGTGIVKLTRHMARMGNRECIQNLGGRNF